MTSDAFIQGMKLLEGALQGDFLPKFLLFLEGRLKDIPDNTWGDVIEYLMRSTKKPRDLTLNDFLRAWTDVRVQAEQQLKLSESRQRQHSGIFDPRSLASIFREMSVIPESQWATSLIEDLETRDRKHEGTWTPEDQVDMLRKKYPERYKEALERQRAGSPVTPFLPPTEPGPTAPPEELPEY